MANPLVSIIIPTWNRAERLTEVCLPSLLSQTHKNIEIVVVGDGCTDDTGKRIRKINDSRVVFKNLSKREKLSPKARLAGLGGLGAGNVAHSMCNGEWISWSNDCDIHTPNQIRRCLNFAIENNYDLVGGVAGIEQRPGRWIFGGNAHTTWLYKEYLRRYKFSEEMFDTTILREASKDKVPMGIINEVFALMPLRPGQKNRGWKYRLAYEGMVEEVGVKKTREYIKRYKIKARGYHR